MWNPTFDLNVQLNRDDANNTTFYSKEYKVRKFNSIYGYGISCNQTNSSTGWANTNSAIRFKGPSYQADSSYQSGLIIFSIDEYTFSAFSSRTCELLTTTLNGTTKYTVRAVINNTGDIAFSSIGVSFSLSGGGTIQTGPLYFTDYTLNTPIAFSWSYFRTSPTAVQVNIYLNGSFWDFLSPSDTPVVNDALIGRNASGSISTSAVGYTIYDVLLFDGIGGSSFGGYLSNSSFTQQIIQQSQSISANLNRKKWLLGSLPSGPVINTNLTGIQASFDYNNRLVRYPRTITFELQK